MAGSGTSSDNDMGGRQPAAARPGPAMLTLEVTEGSRAAPGGPVPQSGRKALGHCPDPVDGVKAVLSPAQWPEHACLQGREGGIQTPRRGWAPSIWEMSAEMTYRIIQWATGNVGRAAIQGIVDHPELELVGCWVHSEDKAGRDAGEIAGTRRRSASRRPTTSTRCSRSTPTASLYSPLMADAARARAHPASRARTSSRRSAGSTRGAGPTSRRSRPPATQRG